MKVDAAKLIQGFELIDNIPSNPVLESSQYVDIEAKGGKLKMRLAGIASAQTEISGEGDIKCLIDRRALKAFLGKTASVITFEGSGSADTKTVVRSGSSRLELPQVKDTGGYGEWKKGQGQNLNVDESLLGLLSEYAQANPGEPHLEVVCFSKGYGAFATDTLVVAACVDRSIASDCLLPRFVAGLAEKINSRELWVEKSGVAICKPGGWVYQPLPASDKSYPKEQMKKVISNVLTEKCFLTVTALGLLEAMTPFNNYSWASDGVLSVECTPSKKLTDAVRMKLDTSTVKVEHYASIIKKGTLPNVWRWPLAKVIPWVSHMKSDAVIEVGLMEHMRWFRCQEDTADRTHCLVVAGEE